MFKNILIATDGSDDARLAADAAGEIADQLGARVVLATVFSPPAFTPETVAYATPPELITEIQAGIIECTSAPLTRRNIAFRTRMETGDAAATIVSIAEQERCDLIVLGSHGAGGIRRFLLGSTSDRVVHAAHCTVMIVKREHAP
jgi:nucleotide-binding universal stress UspA family protein